MSKSLEEEILTRAREARGTAKYMASMHDLVEEKIRQAQESGAFDNLVGHGQPLDLSENPFEPPEMRMANKILKDHGFTPYWMELGKDVDAAIEKFWQEADRFALRIRIKSRDKKEERRRQLEERQMERFMGEAQERLRDINRKIDNFNCHCPMWWMGRPRLNVNEELRRLNSKLNANGDSPDRSEL